METNKISLKNKWKVFIILIKFNLISIFQIEKSINRITDILSCELSHYYFQKSINPFINSIDKIKIWFLTKLIDIFGIDLFNFYKNNWIY